MALLQGEDLVWKEIHSAIKRVNIIIKPAAEHSKWKAASSDLSVQTEKKHTTLGLRDLKDRIFLWPFFPPYNR